MSSRITGAIIQIVSYLETGMRFGATIKGIPPRELERNPTVSPQSVESVKQ